MLSALLAIGWQPEIRGILVVLIGVVVLMGSVYLILSTNIGARLGFLVALAALFGWLASMGAIWWVYGIGLKGREPTWQPAEPVAVVVDPADLADTGRIDQPIDLADLGYPEQAAAVSTALQDNGWTKLPESDPGRGQAIASAEEILAQAEVAGYQAPDYEAVAVYDRGGERWPKINDTFDFLAFRHEPKYAIVEIAPLTPVYTEPGRAPTAQEVDESRPHLYVVMIRDLGSRRQPAAVLTIGGGLIFLLLCWLLTRRDKLVWERRSAALVPAKE